MAQVFIPEGRLAFRLRNLVLRHMPRRWLRRCFLDAIKKESALLEMTKSLAVSEDGL